MKVLILSANTGQGHNSCAQAIRETFESHGEQCEIVDVLGLVSVRLSRSVSQNHEKSYRKTPRLSNAGYRFLEHHPDMFAPQKFVYKVMRTGRKQISQCIREGGYDTVICTHVIAAMILTSAIQEEHLEIRSAFVATDYSCSPGVNGTQLMYYFIPHESLVKAFADAEVPLDRIFPTGIPVRKAFAPASDQVRLKKQFGIEPDHSHLLVMCGSMGCGPIPVMVRTIAASMPDDWEITVVCGTNEELKNELCQEHQNHAGVHIRGYEKEMPALLASADLYLTKPGGLSTSEAAAAAVPMVLVDAVAGCEENNLRHFVKLGMAVTADTAMEVAEVCVELMEEQEMLAEMKQKMRRNASGSAAEAMWGVLHR